MHKLGLQSHYPIVVGDHIVAFLRQNDLDEKAAFLRTGTGDKRSQHVVQGVVTQIYRNGLAAISTGGLESMHCFINLADVVKVLPKPRQNPKRQGLAQKQSSSATKLHFSPYQSSDQAPRKQQLINTKGIGRQKKYQYSTEFSDDFLFDHHVEMWKILHGMAYQKKRNKPATLSKSLADFHIETGGMSRNNNSKKQANSMSNKHNIKSKYFLKSFVKKELHVFGAQKLPRLSRPKTAPTKRHRKKKFQRREIGEGARLEVAESNFKTSRHIEKERRELIYNVFENSETCVDKVQNVQQNHDTTKTDFERDNFIFQKEGTSNFTIIETSPKRTVQRVKTTAIHARHDGARERAFLIEARRNKLLG